MRVATSSGARYREVFLYRLLFSVLMAACGFAQASEGAFFYCPKSDGFVAINIFTKTSIKQFSRAHPFEVFEYNSLTYNGRIFAELERCDTSRYFCVREVFDGKIDRSGFYTFAIPKHIKIGEKYAVDGVNFEVHAAPSIWGRVRVVQIVAKTQTEPVLQYKMYVGQGVGLIGIFFGRIKMPSTLIWNDGLVIDNEYCQFSSGAGIFSAVRISK